MTSVISGLFYTSYSFNINITMKYTLDYATRMPTREKKQLNHGITSMEYGLIFHATHIGGNFHGIWADIPRYSYREIYCKNMRYRIYIYM